MAVHSRGGLVRSDRLVSMALADGKVAGPEAEETDPHATLWATLDNGATVRLAGCGTSLPWRALTELAAAIGRAAREAAASGTVFVFARSAPGGGLSWHLSADQLDSETWPAGPQRPPSEPRRVAAQIPAVGLEPPFVDGPDPRPGADGSSSPTST